MSYEQQIMTIFASTLHDNDWLDYADLKIWPTVKSLI